MTDNLVDLAAIRDAMAVKRVAPESEVPASVALADFLQTRLNGHIIDCITDLRIRMQIAEERSLARDASGNGK
jgi:hypothetical protein